MVALFCLVLLASGRGAGASPSHSEDVLAALLTNFYRQDAAALHRFSNGSQVPAAYWVEARSLTAMLAGAACPHVSRALQDKLSSACSALFAARRDAEAYYPRDMAYAGHVSDYLRPYYDDMNWMAWALLRADRVLGEPWMVGVAEQLFWTIMGAWDATTWGVWWDTAHTQKATASNAGPVAVALELYSRTGNVSYAEFAQFVYATWLEHMVDPKTHQVCDHITPDGATTWWKFTYNEGLFIQASIAMHRHVANGTNVYLQNALDVANFVLENETDAAGAVLSDGDGCDGFDCPLFKGQAFPALVLLNATLASSSLPWSPVGPKLSRVLAESARAIWSLARNPVTNLTATNWAGPFPASSDVVFVGSQASAATSLLAFESCF